MIYTLALGHDGTLWIGTAGGGLSRFIHPSQPALQITDVLGETGNVSQANETIAVAAFDASYLTSPEMFHYAWTLGKTDSSPSLVPETITKSPFYRVHFTSDGSYQLHVAVIDRYGNRSESKTIAYNYISPKPPNFWERLISAWPVITGIFTALYTVSFVTLLVLTKWHAWAYRLICDEAWAKWLTWPFFFLRNVYAVQLWVLTPWFIEISSRIRNNGTFVDPPISCAEDSPSEGLMLLQQLRAQSRLWLHGRSGMGKSSLFSAWEHEYFSEPSLSIAAKKYGFILVMLPVRDYAMLEAPESNRPESWVLEAVRRRLEQFGFATRDLSLIEAMLRVGKIAIALDGMNEANRGSALDAFSKQFKATRLLVTSQAMPGGNQSAEPSNHWQVWELPKNIGELRSRLLRLWLGETGGSILERRIVSEGLSAALVSGYDVRLIADLAEHDPVHAQLPLNRVALYRTILASINGENGEPLDLEGLKKIAWLMVTQRRRRLQSDDEALLGAGTLHILMGEKVRIVRTIGGEREFRHDQMRAFLAALWLFDETPTITALQRSATASHAFELNNRDQEELWGFLAALLKSDATLQELWSFANDDPIERFMLIAALQSEADKRGISLLRLARQVN